MLSADRIVKSYGNQLALDSVSLTVPEGQIHVLLGSSGSGKSTLLRMILGLERADSGCIRIGDQALDSSNPAAWARMVGYMPQDGVLFPHLTAAQNITLVARTLGRPKDFLSGRIEELSKTVALDPALLSLYPRELSGGQRQRAAIMRAAFLNPRVMLLDEPMGALDPLIRFDLQHELKEIFRKLGKTVILVTHDLGEAAFLGDEITLMHQGRVIQAGSLDDLLSRPADEFVTRFFAAQRTLQGLGAPT